MNPMPVPTGDRGPCAGWPLAIVTRRGSIVRGRVAPAADQWLFGIAPDTTAAHPSTS
jgi:hypothetical protein